MSHPFERLTPDFILNAVESTGVLSDARTIVLNSYENRVIQVGIEEEDPVIVKFYRPERWSTAQILEEHQFTLGLAEFELPVVPPNSYHGKTLLEYEGFQFSIFPRKAGHAPNLENLDHLEQLGQVIGRMHSYGATDTFKHRLSLNIETYGKKSQAFLLSNNFLPEYLITPYETLTNDLLALITQIFATNASCKWIRTHGDCHPGNILWRYDAPSFVDFDDCVMAPAIQDIWMLLSGERDQQTLQISTFLEGYEMFMPFDARELNLIESLRTLRLMHYSAWLAKRWDDPAFKTNFTWFNTERYWSEHILTLREQFAHLQAPSLSLFP